MQLDPAEGVTSEQFQEAVAPAVEALRFLTDAVSEVSSRHGGQAWPPSKAIDEIAAEAKTLAKRSTWDGPIRDTHSFGGVTLIAANDYARTFGEAFADSPTPVYGHLVVARSALESSVVSAWLNDPTVDPVERVKRGLCEQLYSAMELLRLDIEENPQERVDRWKTVASEFGWEVRWNRGKPVVDTTQRPSVPNGIEKLLVGDGE